MCIIRSPRAETLDKTITAFLLSVFITKQDVYPPVPPLCHIQFSPDSPFRICHPKPTLESSFRACVAALVIAKTSSSAWNCANTNWERSSAVEMMSPAPDKEAKFQFCTGRPSGLCPCTNEVGTFSLPIVLLGMSYFVNILSWNNWLKGFFSIFYKVYPKSPAPYVSF